MLRSRDAALHSGARPRLLQALEDRPEGALNLLETSLMATPTETKPSSGLTPVQVGCTVRIRCPWLIPHALVFRGPMAVTRHACCHALVRASACHDRPCMLRCPCHAGCGGCGTPRRHG
eukprot:351806-Chlamydomonas_euryale.AAC.9